MSEPPTPEQIAVDKKLLQNYNSISDRKLKLSSSTLTGFVCLGIVALVVCWYISYVSFTRFKPDKLSHSITIIFFLGGAAACACSIYFGGIVLQKKDFEAKNARDREKYNNNTDFNEMKVRMDRFPELYK